jgi:hypothetical protein
MTLVFACRMHLSDPLHGKALVIDACSGHGRVNRLAPKQVRLEGVFDRM